MSLQHAIAAARDAIACYEAGQSDTARDLLIEAGALAAPESGQAAHLSSAMDAFERNFGHGHA